MRLLADVAYNSAVASPAREGGLPSTFWAGPKTIARAVRQGTYGVERLAGRAVQNLKVGYGGDYGYSIDLCYPQPVRAPLETKFKSDPQVKRECLWHGPCYGKASAMVERRNNLYGRRPC